MLLALSLAKSRGLNPKLRGRIVQALRLLPETIAEALNLKDQMTEIAPNIANKDNALFLGRGIFYPIAKEGALKLKEISYIHAEGYPAAEMKHGPIALIDENMPVVVIATNESTREKVISNIQEVKARKGKVLAIIKENDDIIPELADYCIEIPETEEPFTPLLSVIPLQLLAYHIAVLRDCNVDQPRNLAKSVTVE